MKNHNEMYQSLLSRYEEHQEKKKKRILTIKHTIPVLACFCFCAVLGIGYWNHFQKLPNIPVNPNIIDEPTLVETETPTTVPEIKSTTQIIDGNEPISTTAPSTNSKTERKTTTSGKQTQTVTTTVTDSPEILTNEQSIKPTGTQVITTTKPVPNTQTIIEVQTTSPILLPTETLTSAYSNHETPTVTETTEPILPVGPPTQPIHYSDINEAIVEINDSDVSTYPEQDQEVYRYMFEKLKEDGFLYQVNNTEKISLVKDRGITLFPYANYEDVGIGSYVEYKGNSFHVTFYYANSSMTAQTKDIADYLQKRMGRKSDTKLIIRNLTVSIFSSNNGQTYGSAFIDSNHYYDVVTAASEDELSEFLNAFRYVQIPLS